MNGKKIAIILAAGKGTRMHSDVSKQYMFLGEKPILCYCLEIFEKSFIDEIILVTAKDEIEYCKQEILAPYSFKKVTAVVAGGNERYHSVFEGLKCVPDASFIYIHDGARPFIEQELLKRLQEEVVKYGACVTAVPVKDTIKRMDEEGFVVETVSRQTLWSIQTPQVFEGKIIRDAYNKLMEQETKGEIPTQITDDAMVVEKFGETRIKRVMGSYKNIKITTQEDLKIAVSILN